MKRRRVWFQQSSVKEPPVTPALTVPDAHPDAFPRSTFLLIAVAIMVAGVSIRWWTFDVTEFRGDELVYIRYATRISGEGLSQFTPLAREYASDPSFWVFPHPARVLYVLLTAFTCTLAVACSGTAVAAVSFLSGIALVALTMVMARRMFDERIALLSGLLAALSPLQLALSRRAWQDGLFSLIILLALWAFWERSRSPWKGWDILLGGTLLAALLTKESAAIFVCILVGALLLQQWLGTATPPHPRSLLVALLLPLPLAALILLMLIPDPALLFQVYGDWLWAAKTGTYNIAYAQGPWSRYLLDFLLLSPLTTVLAIGYYFGPAGEQRDRFLGHITLSLFVVFSLLALKHARYVGFLDIQMRILAVLTLTTLARHPWAARTGSRGLAVAGLLLAAYDLFLFHTIFVSGGVYDPVTATLAQAERLIP